MIVPHWTHDPLYPHVFQLMELSQHPGASVRWCQQQWGNSDKTMTFDPQTKRLVMIPTGAQNGWFNWGNTSVHFQYLADALIFKLTRG